MVGVVVVGGVKNVASKKKWLAIPFNGQTRVGYQWWRFLEKRAEINSFIVVGIRPGFVWVLRHGFHRPCDDGSCSALTSVGHHPHPSPPLPHRPPPLLPLPEMELSRVFFSKLKISLSQYRNLHQTHRHHHHRQCLRYSREQPLAQCEPSKSVQSQSRN